MSRHHPPSVVLIIALVLLRAVGGQADTGSSLGDRGGEGSTAFTGIAQAPEANLFTGALTTAIPIEVPPGRGSLTPQLALRYAGGAGAGPFGHGWDLPLGRVERSSTWGTPRCTGSHTDDFVLVLPDGASELVRETPGSAFYRPKIEQAWLRAERKQSQNQWVVTDRAGRTYTFGDGDAARVGNSTPPTFMAQDADGTCRLTAVWALTRVEDPNGNVIDIAWSKILNTLYPATVRWGANPAAGIAHVYTARFLPEWRPERDRPISHRLGIAQRLIWRVFAIEIESDLPAIGTPVRTYALQYDDAGDGQTSLLAAVGVSGRPTQHFVYTASAVGHAASTMMLDAPTGAYGQLRVVNDSLEVSQTILDMNGDGLLDLVRSDDAPAASWAVHWGTVDAAGFRFQSPPTAWQAPGNWTHLRNVVVSGGGCNQNGWSCTAADTFDLTGDGIPDHVDASSPTSWTVYRGRGLPQWGFDAGVAWPAPGLRYLRKSKDGDVYQDVVDINGDGLPDLVDSGVPGEAAPHAWLVYLNTGSGFEPTPLPRFPAPVAAVAERVPGGSRHQLVDFNGDGLPDIVRSGYSGFGAWIDPRCQASATAHAACLEVYLNTGQGFGAMEPPIPVPLGYGVQESVDDGDVVQDLFDVNGDGLPDWLYRRFSYADNRYAPEWRVLLNLGGTLEPLTYVAHAALPPPYTEGIPARVWSGGSGFFREQADGDTRADLLDVNGDGFLDHVVAGGAQWAVRLNAAVERPNLLGVMENGLGGTNTIAYRPSTAYDNRGGDDQPDLPAIQWVVAKMRQNDGLCTPPASADPFTAGAAPAANPCIDAGHELVATFQYEGGRFDAATREFRGFRRVVRAANQGSAAPANLTDTRFAQDALASGRILQVDTYAGASTLVRREMNLWGSRVVAPGRSQLWLAENRQATYDTASGGVPLYVAAINDPPDAYGNIVHHRSEGLAAAARVDTYTTYAVPQSGSLLYDRPAAVRIEAADGVLEERWLHYDGSGTAGLALGKVSKGNLKRVRLRLTPSDANGPETRLQYDAAGNLTRVTDALGRATTTAYDGALLYPRTVTNPSGHVTTMAVDYRWGQPTRHIDANGAVTEFTYDLAGRRLCAARPGDALPTCSSATSYHFATQPGTLSWIEVAERQDGPHPPLWTRHYFDALGRARHSEALRVVDGAPTTVRSNQVVYDAAGRVRTLFLPYLASAATPNNGAVTQDYGLDGGPALDPLGRIHRTVNSDGSERRTRYAGARTLSWDEENQRTETDLDPRGNVVARRSYADGALAVTVQQALDGTGRLRHVWQNGVLVKSYDYDSLGRRTVMVDADSGTWRYGYDSVGNLRWQDDPTPGRHVQTCYDALDRPVRRCTVAGDFASLQSCTSATVCTDPERATFGYDTFGIPNALGRRTWAADGSGRTDITAYDARGRRLQVRKTIEVDGVAGEARFAYAYDANDRVISITYPDGEQVRTEYDDGGQPIALYNSANTFYVTDARYDLLGRPTLVRHANGVADTRTYGGPEVQHRLRALRSAAPGATLLDLRYPSYSPRGLLRQIVDDRDPSGARSNALALQYDALGRLTVADSAHDPADRTLAYDGMGNLVRLGDRVLAYGASARPHQLTAVTVGGSTSAVAHDANGNRAGKGDASYVYDSTDRLARADVNGRGVRFLHDADGRQVAKVIEDLTPSVTRMYDRIAEVRDGWQTKSYYLGALRVASLSNTFSTWEQASLGGALYAAAASSRSPALLLVLGRPAQALAGALLVGIGVTLLAVGGRRRPAVVGLRVRPGHAVAVALLCATGTLPWPLVVAPPAAFAGGYAGGETARHYHVDHLGSTQVISSSSGTAIEQIRYLPFGAVRGRWDGSGTALSGPSGVVSRDFAGYQTDTVSGLAYAGARFYDPELGSFLTHDPRGQFTSPYSYGGGDPMNWTDPNGEFFVELITAIVASAFASAALNAVIAAAQGAPLGTIGKAALGGAVAGALGAGIGIAVAAGSMGASAMAGTLAQNVALQQAQQALVDVAWRAAFSSTAANAAGQTAAAAGAPSGAVIAASVVAGFAASYGFDQAFAQDLGGVVRQGGGQNGAALCSNTADHSSITGMAAADAGFGANEVDTLVAANLDRDLQLANNQDHFDFLTQQTADSLRENAVGLARGSDTGAFLRTAGAASHHLQDQYALGHIFPGTSTLGGPVGAPLRFLVHNAVGGEITFRQASYDATLNLFRDLRAEIPTGA